mmetsp:Transcript_6559/g.7501  ORF Transcript_6559/g.7501 Transcript_6559/m.7501 type:complete len:333 (+) Transcript_6559:292-1290(+)
MFREKRVGSAHADPFVRKRSPAFATLMIAISCVAIFLLFQLREIQVIRSGLLQYQGYFNEPSQIKAPQEADDTSRTDLGAVKDTTESAKLQNNQDNSVWCNLCEDYDWIFILGTGRSGSTSILNMVNTLPGFYLAGENGRSIKTFYKLPFFDGNERQKELEGLGVVPRGPYKHKNVNINSLYCSVQRYYRDIVGYSKKGKKFAVTGFKEVEITEPGVLKFMAKAFPCARFIVNYRKDLKAQHASKFQKEVPLFQLRKATNSLLEWATENGERTFVMPLEDFSVSLFNKMLDWIGVSGCVYKDVLHANKGGYKDDVNVTMAGTCSYSRAQSSI